MASGDDHVMALQCRERAPSTPSVPECRDAILTRESEDALWQVVFPQTFHRHAPANEDGCDHGHEGRRAVRRKADSHNG